MPRAPSRQLMGWNARGGRVGAEEHAEPAEIRLCLLGRDRGNRQSERLAVAAGRELAHLPGFANPRARIGDQCRIPTVPLPLERAVTRLNVEGSQIQTRQVAS